jgi:hypothetical protein
MITKTPEQVFSDCEELHNSVAELYEAIVDDRPEDSEKIILDIESRLSELKK